MGLMQIVIKMPEEMYKQIIDKNGINTMLIPYSDIIRNGTPIPKGHGALKDADELHNIFKKNCDAYNIDNLSFISDMDMNFDLAPTIVEADTAEDCTSNSKQHTSIRKLTDTSKFIDSLKGIERLHKDDELRSSILDALYANTLEVEAPESMEKLQKIEQIIKDHDNDRMPEDYFYIDKIRKVLEK